MNGVILPPVWRSRIAFRLTNNVGNAEFEHTFVNDAPHSTVIYSELSPVNRDFESANTALKYRQSAQLKLVGSEHNNANSKH